MLAVHAVPDPEFPRGVIESVYFDDEALSAYREKADGDALKSKVRLRWYPGSPLRPDGRANAFLEIKDRIGAAREKRHLRLDADPVFLEGAPLHDERWIDWLYAQAGAQAVPLPFGLEPVISIRYRRHRFVCPFSGARLAIDDRLESPRGHDGRFGRSEGIEAGVVVCEAKSSTWREWPWNGALARCGFRPESFSKYGFFMTARINGNL